GDGRTSEFAAWRQHNIQERLGLPLRSWALLTKAVMIVVQMGYYGAPRIAQGTGRRVSDLANVDPHLWVHDKATGETLAAVPLPQNATGSPITFLVGSSHNIPFPVGRG